MRVDAIVLGAGIVGTAAALQLQRKGLRVALLDRRGPGEETSFGNAGLIQREAFYPYSFPRGLGKLIRYALNGTSEAHYHLSALPWIAGPLFQYWRNAAPARIERTIRANRPLFENCLTAHQSLAAEAGVSELLRPGGWIQIFRKEASLKARLGEAKRLAADFAVRSTELSAESLAAIEPHLITTQMAGAIHWHDPVSLREPLRLTQAYAALFERKGGVILTGDARTLMQQGRGWQVHATTGSVQAEHAVVALGPWSSDIYEPLGYRIPMFVKRGYHAHYQPVGNATLMHPVIDADAGFAMAAMDRGIRVTTGAEFARRESAPTPVQMTRVAPLAREWLPLGDQVESLCWMGQRPCLPDMIPVIGPAPRHPGLWFLFGHAHHGLTNAAISGQILADIVTNQASFCDSAPFAVTRDFDG